MIRVAAVGDIHLGEDSGMQLRPAFDDIDQHADILLLAGDLTRTGTAAEAMTVAGEFAELPVPVVAVLGNHDYTPTMRPSSPRLCEITVLRCWTVIAPE